MILVDSSVWINFFRGKAGAPSTLTKLIKGKNRVAITGVILQEVLQGIKEDRAYEMTRHRLSFLPYLEPNRDVFLLAASLYRDLRKKGITVPSTDTVIAAVALHHGVSLFTEDRHFKEIATTTPLRLLRYPEVGTC